MPISEEKFLVLIGGNHSPTPQALDAPEGVLDDFRDADTVLAVRSDYSSAYVMKHSNGQPGACEVQVRDMRVSEERDGGDSATIRQLARERDDRSELLGWMAQRLVKATGERDAERRRANELEGALRVAQQEVARHVSDGVRGEQHRAVVAENAALLHHSSRLVELLHDAWWVEAAQHLHELGTLTREASGADAPLATFTSDGWMPPPVAFEVR